jgi:hypothetical protein
MRRHVNCKKQRGLSRMLFETETDMKTLKELPIFCGRCPTLAFAILDDAPLCEACLVQQIDANGGLLSTMKIEPLQFIPPKTSHAFTIECFI